MFHIIFRLAAGRHATFIIMAHVRDGRALRDSPLPRLNRINGTLSREKAFSTLAQLSSLVFFMSRVGCRSRSASPSSIICLYSLLAVFSLRSVLRILRIVPRRCFLSHSYSVPPLSHRCATAALRVRYVVRSSAFLFEKERKKGEQGVCKGDRKYGMAAVAVVVAVVVVAMVMIIPVVMAMVVLEEAAVTMAVEMKPEEKEKGRKKKAGPDTA